MVAATTLASNYRSQTGEQVYSDIKPWNTEVRDIPITFYVHMNALTEIPDDGVVKVAGRVILSRSKRLGTWRIDGLDWEIDDCRLTYQHVSERAIKMTILRGLILQSRKVGIDPRNIRGWQRWCSGFILGHHMDLMGLKYD